VTASDGVLTVSDAFRLTISPVNDRPVLLTPIADAAGDEDQPIDILLPQGTFGDIDGDALTVTALLAGGAPLPLAELRRDPLHRNAAADYHGAIDIAVTASDGTLSVSDNLPANDQPGERRADPGIAYRDVRRLEDKVLDILLPNGTFADRDGDALAMSATLATALRCRPG
jgi:hypothetical protein